MSKINLSRRLHLIARHLRELLLFSMILVIGSIGIASAGGQEAASTSKPDLIGIQRTGTSYTAVQVVSGTSGYTQQSLSQTTPLINSGSSNPSQWIFFMGDYDKDGIPDLIGVQRENTGTGYTEVHVLSGASGYTQWLVNVATPMGKTGSSTNGQWLYFLADYNKDGVPDLIAINRENTGSGYTEIHVLSGASGYTQWSLHAATPIAKSGSSNAGEWLFFMADYDGDGIPDLIGVQRENTSSGNTEVYVLSGASGYTQWLLHATTPIAKSGSSNAGEWLFYVADYDGDGKPDLIGVQRENTGTGYTEVHVLSGASGYTTWLVNNATPIAKSGSSNAGQWLFYVADYNGDGKPDLIGVQRENTGTGYTEVHVLSGASGYTTWLVNTATPLAKSGSSNAGEFAFCVNYKCIPNQDAYNKLTVNANNTTTANGTVTSSSVLANYASSIRCSGATCSAMFPIDDTVTLTETPSVYSSTFGGWSGANTTNGNTCMVKMSTAKSVTATFNLGFEKPLLDSAMGVAE
ncbi:MAG: VCBS repeat-containing protein [Nitrospirae bacterium]|nr:VCBS repeat-containing protein [Nitrospirota bacterium]